MTRIVNRAGWIAVACILGIGALATGSGKAAADRLVYQCDEDNDNCQPYACDWDGDDCHPVRHYAYRQRNYPQPYYVEPPRYTYPQPYYGDSQPSVGFFFGFGGRGHGDDDDD